MNSTLGCAALAAVIALAPASSTIAGQAQGLRRLPPAQNEQFQPEGWADRLKSGDLDKRQRAFEQIVELSRRDEGARGWLRERAQDGKQADLAWTCRLALREVERGSPFGGRGSNAGPNDRFGGGAGGGWGAPFAPHGSAPDGWIDAERLRAEFDRIMEEMQRSMPVMPNLPALPAVPQGGGRDERREVSIQIDEHGAVVRVTTQEDGGEEQTDEYRADSLDEILREHPELSGELGGIQIGTGHGAFGFGPGRAQDDVPPPQPRRLLPRPGPGANAAPPAAPSGAPRTDRLGVYIGELGGADRQKLGLDEGVGLSVENVEPNSIAAALGLRSGDTLVEIGGKPIAGREDIGAALRARGADGELTATWIDAWGQRRTRTWRPAAAPQGNGK